MAFKICPRLTALTLRLKSHPTAVSTLSSGCGLTVEHDRQNRRFTVTPGSGAGKQRAGQVLSREPGVHSRPAETGYWHWLLYTNLYDGLIYRDHDCAVLYYRFTGEKEVDLMSTYVPASFRGQGVAALLSQAAMDYLVEEKLKAHVSCWYIKKYIKDHPLQRYKELVIT
ncbi:hypothetical protein FQN60_004206 [Etheostoma spectabile]|uniref:Protein NATD1 n=1 Tax=Etheostoma spectabile TaxID=54343 RepID=A0A5J5CT25_9PERO|nr:hypothetical protein FQN60_004206 [Etheostoma spectabile]